MTDADVVLAALQHSGEAVFRVRGTSMAPFLPDGTLVVLRPATGAPAIGDVVARRTAAGGLQVHRVVAAGASVVTRGDAHAHDDTPSRPDEILGVVVALELRGRRVPLDGPVGRLAGRALATTLAPALRALRRTLRRLGWRGAAPR